MIQELAPETICGLRELRGITWGNPLVVVASTTSTNDDAKKAMRDGAPNGAAFVADAQTLGRGRQGHTWHSPSGVNLYASFVLRPHLTTESLPLVTLASGLAIADVVRRRLPREGARRVGIKWPNDVLCGQAKIAGILCEAQMQGGRTEGVIVGIGLNVSGLDMPDELAHRATSLRLEGGTRLHRGELFVELAEALERRIGQLERGDRAALLDSVRALDCLKGRALKIDGERAFGVTIDDDGGLRVLLESGGERVIVAGEIHLVAEGIYDA